MITRLMVNKVKYLLSVNWYATLKVNFSLLPYSQARRLPILIKCKIKLSDLTGKIIINCPLEKGLVEIGSKIEAITTSAGVSQLGIGGDFVINGRFMIADDVRIIISKGACLTIGEHSFIGRNTSLIVTNNVYFGKYVRFAYDSQLISTNFHYMADMETHVVKRMSNKGIVINDYCWIGNTSTIMNGTVLPEKSIVASHSLVNKDYSNLGSYPLIGGTPAKLIALGRVRVYNENTERIIDRYFKDNPEANEYNITNLDVF